MFSRIWLEPGAVPPKRGSRGASGYDLAAMSPAKILAGEAQMVSTGVHIQCGEPDLEIQVRSRSGLAMKRIFVLGGIGTVDSDYTGEIMVLLMNLSKQTFYVSKGDRVAQLVFARVVHPEFRSEPFITTERGVAGWGSTG